MAVERFRRVYLDHPLATGILLTLNRAQSHHLVTVLRLGAGSKLVLFNNTRGEFDAELLQVERKCATLSVGDFLSTDRESLLQTHIAAVLSKGDRVDTILQKAVELGAQKISLLTSDHSVVRFDDARIGGKLLHWQGIVIAAAEQCGRNRFPVLTKPQGIDEFLDQATADSKIMLHPEGKRLKANSIAPQSVILMTGPEGGFSQRESDLAEDAGYHLISMGPRIMRAETAPLSALTLVQHYWGDL